MTMSPLPVADCCTPLAAPLSTDGANRLASALRVLADPARLKLLSLIARGGEACVCNLTEPLGLSQPTVSHHLRVLHEAGLLRRERRGRWAFYSADPEPLRMLAESISIPEREEPGIGDAGVLSVAGDLSVGGNPPAAFR
jgi:ArsR family transcriptional regulator